MSLFLIFSEHSYRLQSRNGTWFAEGAQRVCRGGSVASREGTSKGPGEIRSRRSPAPVQTSESMPVPTPYRVTGITGCSVSVHSWGFSHTDLLRFLRESLIPSSGGPLSLCVVQTLSFCLEYHHSHHHHSHQPAKSDSSLRSWLNIIFFRHKARSAPPNFSKAVKIIIIKLLTL